jgi:hypothetical protein
MKNIFLCMSRIQHSLYNNSSFLSRLYLSAFDAWDASYNFYLDSLSVAATLDWQERGVYIKSVLQSLNVLCHLKSDFLYKKMYLTQFIIYQSGWYVETKTAFSKDPCFKAWHSFYFTCSITASITKVAYTNYHMKRNRLDN